MRLPRTSTRESWDSRRNYVIHESNAMRFEKVARDVIRVKTCVA